MKLGSNIRLLVSGVLLCCVGDVVVAATMAFQQTPVQQDTTKNEGDTLKPYEPTKVPSYQPTYRFGDPFSNRLSPSPLELDDPSSIDLEVEYDSGINYTVYEKVGDVNFRPISTMSFQEYDRYHDREIAKGYFKERSAGLDGESAVSGRELIPRLYLSPMFDRLFGGSYVDIKPNGFVNLDFGGRFQRVDNPAIPLRQQRNGGFNFDQQISMNLVGKVGEKLAITANFDNNNTFDFQNNLKVEYTGFEEDIVKKIEIGNVSMPISNGLMTGAQSLFGLKTQLQFGKLYVTSVLSRQQGQSEVITVESGFQGKEFEVRASDYDENRHFFLGHFFRDNYELWLGNLPNVVSGVNITRVEVYVMNRNQDTRTTRNVIGFMDLGEGNPSHVYRDMLQPAGAGPTRNGANDLYPTISGDPSIRASGTASATLEGMGFVNSTDYVLIKTARKLDESEFTVNTQLGYITLLRKLQNDEMLAVSYEYTYNGNTYKVGELTEDYAKLSDDQVIYMKMLRPNKINTEVPTWDLMMKNIYSLNASQIEREGFVLRVHYRDDRTGIDNPSLHESSLKDRPLIELLGLDQLNRNNDRQRDGTFDFIDGVTIDTRNGNIIFPVLEPFGSNLRRRFQPGENTFIEKYVYDTLYATTKADAEQVASKNKFWIQGKYNAGSSSEIVLPGINIAENSVVVTAGNTPLTEGLDYNVDYNLGRVRILNEGILSSGKTINISYEKADLFNFQSRWLYGTHAEYRFSENFNIGATLLHLNERPGGVSRYKIGDEPTSNTKYGFDISFQKDVNFLTKAVDFLPLISTKVPSNIAFNAEFAQMVPGTSNVIDGKGTSYIDDFESAIIPINLGGWQGWDLASTPATGNNRFDRSTPNDPLGVNYKRAKIAWYTVDNSVFYRSGGPNRPANLEESDLENHYVRPILPQEIFRQRDRNLVVTNEQIFDIAYFPSERGQYNYSTDLNSAGFLNSPETNWGGITRAITNEVDFDKTNIEYIEFWLLDPFITTERGRVLDGFNNTQNTTGGELIFNLGSVSEDMLKDGQHAFENGLPADGDVSETEPSAFGRMPSDPFLTNYFENSSSSRQNQDIGLDGLNNGDEAGHFTDFVNFVNSSVSNPQARQRILDDPSADDFQYYLGENLDSRDLKILERYKSFNGLENNSPTNSSQAFTQASTTIPDNEDLNMDNTISDLEEYFEYRVPLPATRGALDVGNGYVVDKVTDQSGEATWYLFRIPVRDQNAVRQFGSPSFKNIRYIRMYMTGFSQPVVLRMAKFQLVGSQWRKYRESLQSPGLGEIPESSFSDFNVTVVNIEENGTSTDNKSPYVIPPGVNRDRDNTTVINRQVNEQSLQICVEDLEDQDIRAVFKNVGFDLINYGTLKMFLHAEAHQGDVVRDDEVTGFLRLGTDFTENYYEIEVPLKITPPGVSGNGDQVARLVWPEANEIDIEIDELLSLKAARNRGDFDNLVPFSRPSRNGRYTLTIKGRPDISAILTMMIGVKNPRSEDRAPKSVCIWANELRVTDFDKTKGWAANARMSVKLADLGTVTGSTRYTSIGFGNIQQNIQQRTREETFQYDVSANLNLDKFLLPEKTGLKVPMFVSYEESTTTPQFDPLDPDVPLEASLQSLDPEDRDDYRRIVEDRSIRRSINFTNVHKERINTERQPMFFAPSNFSFSYAYSDVTTSNVNTQTYFQQNVSGGLGYTYSPVGLTVEPFANSSAFNSPWLKLIKDINLSFLPSNISFRGDLRRSYTMTQLYNEDLDTAGIPAYYERLFTFNRAYNVRWAPFKSLNIDYSAAANAVIDEPDSVIEGNISTRSERDYIWNRIKDFGRLKNFTQDVTATYKTPLDKFPVTDWLSADLKYAAGYTWTAGSLGQNDPDSVFFGHTIQNARDRGVSGKVDFVKLYNKVTFLKEVNTPPRRSGRNQEAEAEAGGSKVGKGILRFLMSVRSVNIAYNIRESTILPGFNVTPFLLGMDSSLRSPGWKFLLGDQDPSIRTRASDNGWMTRSAYLTSPFQQTYSTNLDLRASVEPGKDLKIQLDAKRTNTASYQEIYRFVYTDPDSTMGEYQSLTPTRSGSYNLSFLSINTAFRKMGNDNSSPTFNEFRENIEIIRARANTLNANGEYDTLAQDVLIPAFIAAYSGKSPNEVELTPFPRIPLPNWRADYTGLGNIPALADIFSSVSLTHGYRSTYSVNSYTNSLRYSDNLSLQNDIINYNPADANLLDSVGSTILPIYIINQVTISEQFTPLIGINVRTKNNIATRIDYKKERNLSLNMSNASVTETRNQDITLNFDVTKDNFKLPFKIKGRTITLENDLTFRLSMTLRDSETIQRSLEGDNQVTNGSTSFQFRPSASYKLNRRLDLTMYFERSVTNPKVSSFRTATTAFGTQLRFSLAQ